MKFSKILMSLVFAFVVFSCSKNSDPAPSSNLETASISFSGETKIAQVPSAMASSQDPYAQMTAGYVTSVNAITGYLTYFTPPSTATKSSTAITASNGRVSSTQKDYLVYTWSDATYGSITYQVSLESDKYVFELFFKGKNKSSWLRYVYAEEMKDKSAGLMKIYDIFTGGPATNTLVTYNWTRGNDVLNFTMSMSDSGINFKIAISINEKTKAGSIVYTLDGAKLYQIVWDTKGNGTWTWYDDDGIKVLETGKWTV